ncbi:MAG: hypothetical protein K2K53_07565 [Oscillospiraceae bacterium]|nr:hypothetical protein [Oscillospiraceae bacterium]
MKNVILSADGDYMLYSVPDAVAGQLDEYCMEFCREWLWKSPHAEKYRKTVRGTVCVCYNEADFIAYLNQWVSPDEQSVLQENLGAQIPEEYRNSPAFHF